jgi:hypothetical protein
MSRNLKSVESTDFFSYPLNSELDLLSSLVATVLNFTQTLF